MRICSRCKEGKEYSQFRPRARGGVDSYCISCRNAYQREDYQKHKEARALANRERYQANKDKYHYNPGYRKQWRSKHRERLSAADWTRRLRRNYGISVARYTEMLAEQQGRCALCGSEKSWSRSERFAVDHDHLTGQVRALLCHQCNVGLGRFGDDSALLRKAADYIERFRRNA